MPTAAYVKRARLDDAQNRARHDGVREGGFTLLEVLVALGILGMSLSVLLGVFSLALDRTRESRQKEAAYSLAEALLLKAETTPSAEIKDATGFAEPQLRWRLHVQDYGSDQDRAHWQGHPVEVWVTVNWEDHGRTRSVSLSTLRFQPGPNHA